MRCSNCGHEIPSGMLYCQRCGEEVRIVPDYNPLDDMLTAQVKISINGDNADYFDYASNRQPSSRRNQSTINRNTRKTGNMTPDERAARRRQAERRREIKRKKRRRLLIIMAAIFVAFIGILIFLYQTSYTGIVKKGNKALLSSEYAVAQEHFEKAISKKPEQAEAYVGLAQVYIAKGDLTKAENVYLDAISSYPDNVSIYESLILFYIDSDQALKIPKLMNDASDKIQKGLSEYIISKPEFSLEAGKVYDDVQQLTLTSNADVIYYTTDGSEPTFNSTKYSEPIQLDEGETTIKAIAVNKKGVPSLPGNKTYVIELPIEDAPAIYPSTGQYEEQMYIEIKVPDGYTAYYTMDGSTPTTASSKYTNPIKMPENDTLFKAILVSSSGRSSGVTTRNYNLEIPESEE